MSSPFREHFIVIHPSFSARCNRRNQTEHELGICDAGKDISQTRGFLARVIVEYCLLSVTTCYGPSSSSVLLFSPSFLQSPHAQAWRYSQS
eukprot:765099-Hanusia_phi.AAC.3